MLAGFDLRRAPRLSLTERWTARKGLARGKTGDPPSDLADARDPENTG